MMGNQEGMSQRVQAGLGTVRYHYVMLLVCSEKLQDIPLVCFDINTESTGNFPEQPKHFGYSHGWFRDDFRTADHLQPAACLGNFPSEVFFYNPCIPLTRTRYSAQTPIHFRPCSLQASILQAWDLLYSSMRQPTQRQGLESCWRTCGWTATASSTSDSSGLSEPPVSLWSLGMLRSRGAMVANLF